MLDYKEYQIELDGCHNFRDLGGFPGTDGATCYEVAYRADALGELSERDVTCMKDLGISTIIDLRTPEERSAVPDVIASDADFDYITLSLMNQSAADLEDITQLPTLTELYIDLLENQPAGFKKIGQIILNAPGGVVFHCTAGKDRTGVTAALLLGLAGVDRRLIVDSYAKVQSSCVKNFGGCSLRGSRKVRRWTWWQRGFWVQNPNIWKKRWTIWNGISKARDSIFWKPAFLPERQKT